MSNDAPLADVRYAAADLVAYATTLLGRAGLAADRAATVAEILVEGDLMGHTTHGLALLAPYLADIAGGRMTVDGDPATLADRGATLLLDGRYLPGPWLVVHGIEEACRRVADHGVALVVIRRSHHIACLAAYLRRATDRGFMLLLVSSDPAAQSVAPHGGLVPVYTPNPIAAGIPTQGDPILLDVSMSTTTNGLTARLHKAGRRLPHPWVKDGQGRVTDDPSVLFADPAGTVLPLGGLDLGHKGFALGLLVEALTSGLGGFGRADRPTNWGASVFIQVTDPAAFGGREAFARETSWLAQACRANPVPPGNPPVRLPGAGGLERRAAALAEGVAPYPGILEALEPWAAKLAVRPPAPLSSAGASNAPPAVA